MADVSAENLSGGVALITLNRPFAMNSLGGSLMEEFHEAVRRADEDSSVGAIAVTGAGRAFCAGADLRASISARDRSAEDNSRGYFAARQEMRRMHTAFAGAVYNCAKPTVALINGPAAGGGLGMALAADFRIAAEQAIFVSAFSKIALPGDNGITYGLQRLVGRSRALEILYLSPRLTAAEALNMGLINRVVPGEDLIRVGLEFSARLAAGPTLIYALIKENVTFAETATYAESLEREEMTTPLSTMSDDYDRAVAAFLNKE